MLQALQSNRRETFCHTQCGPWDIAGEAYKALRPLQREIQRRLSGLKRFYTALLWPWVQTPSCFKGVIWAEVATLVSVHPGAFSADLGKGSCMHVWVIRDQARQFSPLCPDVTPGSGWGSLSSPAVNRWRMTLFFPPYPG